MISVFRPSVGSDEIEAAIGDEVSPAERVAPELDPVGAVDEPVEDGVGDRRLAEGFVPVADRELAGDDRGAAPVAVLDQLEEVGRLGRQRLAA